MWTHCSISMVVVPVRPAESLTYEAFRDEFVRRNRPVLVRGFLDARWGCDADRLRGYIERPAVAHHAYRIGTADALEGTYDPALCAHPVVRGLQADPDVTVGPGMRLWRHDRGHVTPWHYDGHGGDLLNVAVCGAKRFELAPPGHMVCWPLSNVALWPGGGGGAAAVRLRAGDTLYLPANWFHRVRTLADGSLNLNYAFFGLTPAAAVPRRQRELIAVHAAVFGPAGGVCETTAYCVEPGAGRTAAAARCVLEVGLGVWAPCCLLWWALDRHGAARGRLADAVLVGFLAVALSVAASPGLTPDTFGVSRVVAVTAAVGWLAYPTLPRLLRRYSGATSASTERPTSERPILEGSGPVLPPASS